MKERALALASRLEAVGRNKDMGRPPINDTEREAAALIRELQSRLESLEKELVKEAARTAEEKLRADQMTKQHQMQARMHAEANDRFVSLEKDAARLDWLESSKESHAFCHVGYDEHRYYAHQKEGYATVREVIDEAMKG